MIDPGVVYHDPMPAEWDTISPDILAQFPLGKFLFTERELALRDHILANRWYLLTNGHRAVCGSCGQFHHYMTRACIELPYNALQHPKVETIVPELVDEDHVKGVRMRLREREYRQTVLGEAVPIAQADARRLLARIELQERTRRILHVPRSTRVS